MNILPRISPEREEEVFIISIEGHPTFMYSGGQLWVRIESLWEWLSVIERAILLTGRLKLVQDDPDSGTYGLFDDFVLICPKESKAALRARKRELLAMVKQERGKQP